MRKTTHKYGVELPRDVKHAMELDRKNENSFWRDAMALEMTQIGIAIEVTDDGVQAPSGWSKVTGHLVWGVKIDLTRKARWVLDGHKTADVSYSTYADVVWT